MSQMMSLASDRVMPNLAVTSFSRGVMKFFNFFRFVHAAYAVVTAGYDTNQPAGGSAVIGNGNGGMAGFCFQCENVGQCIFRERLNRWEQSLPSGL